MPPSTCSNWAFLSSSSYCGVALSTASSTRTKEKDIKNKIHRHDLPAPLTNNFELLELPCRDLVGKEDIEFGERETTGFGQSEEGPCEADQVAAIPEQGALRLPVPSIDGDHTSTELCPDDCGHQVYESAENDGATTKSSGGQFTGDRIA